MSMQKIRGIAGYGVELDYSRVSFSIEDVKAAIEEFEQLQAKNESLKEEMTQLIDICMKIRREVIAQTNRIVGKP